jgi:DNA-binding response OmpR family regulator
MRNVLIVEDEMLVALDLEDILTQSGYEVLGIVADLPGTERVGKRPVVALVDLNLRDGPTGNAVARKLAEMYGTRIVFVTANPAQISDPPPTAIGYVQKPFRADAVLSAISAAIACESPEPSIPLRAFS